jgi:hypothetical protein
MSLIFDLFLLPTVFSLRLSERASWGVLKRSAGKEKIKYQGQKLKNAKIFDFLTLPFAFCFPVFSWKDSASGRHASDLSAPQAAQDPE